MRRIPAFTSRRSGFTIVELTVIAGIVGISLALALPALQRAREADRLTRCKAILKQLGVALHSYHDTHDRFPYASTFSVTSSGQPGGGHTWIEFLLPHMDMS